MAGLRERVWSPAWAPLDWVIEHDGDQWLVPAREDGWAARKRLNTATLNVLAISEQAARVRELVGAPEAGPRREAAEGMMFAFDDRDEARLRLMDELDLWSYLEERIDGEGR